MVVYTNEKIMNEKLQFLNIGIVVSVILKSKVIY